MLNAISQSCYRQIIWLQDKNFKCLKFYLNFLLKLRNKLINYKNPIIEMPIEKHNLLMKLSHNLPLYMSVYKYYDRTLPRLSNLVQDIDKKLILIDIGANIGDTVSLLVDGSDRSFLCVEGDEEYIPILMKNKERLKNAHIEIETSFCGSSNETQNINIKRVIAGSSQIIFNDEGSAATNIKTLDSMLDKHELFKQVNVLKIDTDGFELHVLKGAKTLLSESKPLLYIEFAPEFILKNNEDPILMFPMLDSLGYKKVLFYDNFGIPMKIVDANDQDSIKALIELIDNNKIFYYDIVTYHESLHDKYATILDKELDFFKKN